MSSFTTPLKVEFIDGKNWKVLEAFEYHVGKKDSKEVITVPIGFKTDFASIPRAFYTLIGPPTGEYGKAAVIHDYLYRNAIGTRKRADKIFYEAMGVLGVSAWKRKVIYWAVRIFGRGSWK